MDETEQLAQAQQDAQAREAFLAQNDEFICRCASKAAGRFVDEHDDAYSEALIAFNNAVTAYRPEKGAFHALAATAIRNRVTIYCGARAGTAAVFRSAHWTARTTTAMLCHSRLLTPSRWFRTLHSRLMHCGRSWRSSASRFSICQSPRPSSDAPSVPAWKSSAGWSHSPNAQQK